MVTELNYPEIIEATITGGMGFRYKPSYVPPFFNHGEELFDELEVQVSIGRMDLAKDPNRIDPVFWSLLNNYRYDRWKDFTDSKSLPYFTNWPEVWQAVGEEYSGLAVIYPQIDDLRRF